MRVLVLTQHFAPEVTAARFRLEAFVRGLDAAGHSVDVVCAVPNHPQGSVPAAFRGRALVRRRRGRVRVRHVWVAASPRKTAAHRLALYASYAVAASAVGAAQPRPDVILASSPPLPAGAAGAVVAARHRVPWIFDVRDVWPDVAVALGKLSQPALVRAASALELALYRSAAAITAPTDAFRATIASRVTDPDKVSIVANGTTAEWLEMADREVDRRRLGLPADAFVWAYAGNVGLSQDLDSAVVAAERLGDGFRLVIVGDGPARTRLEQRAQTLPDGAVTFTGLLAPGSAAELLRAADAALVPLAVGPVHERVVPIKLYDSCAVARPVVLAAAGAAARVAERTGCALVVPPGDPGALADAVRRLRDDPSLRATLAAAGRAFAGEHQRERQVAGLVALVEAVGT